MASTSNEAVGAGAPARTIAPRQRLVDEAYNAIKQMIITNEIRGGDVISVVGLAERLGVSRSPVKQAIVALEQDGFVHSEPFRAPRVATITTKFIRDVYGVRTALESQAAGDSVDRMTDDELRSLKITYDRLIAQVDESDDEEIFAFDIDLHRHVVHRADNGILSNYLANLEHHVIRIRNVYGQHVFSHAELMSQLDELGSIVAALAKRDAPAAAAAMKAHVMSHATRLIAKVEESNIDL